MEIMINWNNVTYVQIIGWMMKISFTWWKDITLLKEKLQDWYTFSSILEDRPSDFTVFYSDI